VDVFKKEIKADTKEWKADAKQLEQEMKVLQSDTKAFQHDIKDFQSDTNAFQREMRVFQGDMKVFQDETKAFQHETKTFQDGTKAFQHDIVQKFDTIGTVLTSTIEHGQKDVRRGLNADMAAFSLDVQTMLSKSAIDQEKQLSDLYARSFFIVSLILYVIYQILTQSSCLVSQHY
jgi:chromosome segregation ATPase